MRNICQRCNQQSSLQVSEQFFKQEAAKNDHKSLLIVKDKAHLLVLEDPKIKVFAFLQHMIIFNLSGKNSRPIHLV